jgi:hypothetical protein
MGVVAINNEEACTTIGLLCCVFLEVGEPKYSKFAVCPSFLRVTESYVYAQCIDLILA